MKSQAAWGTALRDPDRAVPAGLVTWNGSDPAQRFAVYRNNVTVSLMQALADTFPVCAASVGEACFRDLARAFVRRHPPRSPVLARYGEGFADFVAASRRAAPWPYLPDLARLELACLDALQAADASPLDPATLAAALGRPETLPALRLSLHPSLATLDSPFAVVSRWAAQPGDGAPPVVDPDSPEHAWILRRGRSVRVLPMSAGDCRFVRALQAGATLGEAAATAAAGESGGDRDAAGGFDLTRCLAVLLRERILTGVTLTTPTQGDGHDH
jgi:hypothetical protein